MNDHKDSEPNRKETEFKPPVVVPVFVHNLDLDQSVYGFCPTCGKAVEWCWCGYGEELRSLGECR